MRAPLLLSLLLGLSGTPDNSQAAEEWLKLPADWQETYREDLGARTYNMPIARFTRSSQPTRDILGDVTIRAYRIPAGLTSPEGLLARLRDDLDPQGFQQLFRCADRDCGGFDFRANIEVLPPPAIEMGLADFAFLGLSHPDGGQVGLLATRSERGLYVQVTEVSPKDQDTFELELVEQPEAETLAFSGGGSLFASGAFVLEAIRFEEGARGLAEAGVESLSPIAEYLRSNTDAKIVVVGHTDAIGGLDGNMRVSKARAEAVRRALIESYDIAADRITAEGVGYLAPRATNETEEGRALNRRVEVILR